MFLLLALGCPDPPDSGDSSDTGPTLDPWQVVAANLSGAVLSIWGDSADEVFVVGADAGDGPMNYRLAGDNWVNIAVDGLDAGDLWWVSGDDERVWMAGAGGRVFRQDRSTLSLEAWTLDAGVTLFGVWGPGDGTAWAVGGNTEVPSDAASAWYFDGTTWAEVSLPPEVAAQYALFKVWGSAANDVWAVGTAGVSMHWDGAGWSYVDTVVPTTLFTVHDGYAVGGSNAGTILSLSTTGMVWADESPDYALQFNGVYGGDAPVAVGVTGSIWFRDDEAWVVDPRERATYQDLHATWVDPEGNTWAVGGHVSSAPLIQGTILRLGSAAVPTL